jgi:hypothetical protein
VHLHAAYLSRCTGLAFEVLNDFFYISDEGPNTLMNLLRPTPTAERQYRLHGDACFFTLFHCLGCAYKVLRQFLCVILFTIGYQDYGSAPSRHCNTFFSIFLKTRLPRMLLSGPVLGSIATSLTDRGNR